MCAFTPLKVPLIDAAPSYSSPLKYFVSKLKQLRVSNIFVANPFPVTSVTGTNTKKSSLNFFKSSS